MSDHSHMVGASYSPKCHADTSSHLLSDRVHVLANSCVQVTPVSCVCIHVCLSVFSGDSYFNHIHLSGIVPETFANMIQVVSREHLPLTY